MAKIRTTTILFALGIVAGLAVAPIGAMAATTIGSNLLAASPAGGLGCPNESCTVSNVAPLGVAPSTGVVVLWRVKVGATTSPAALRILRPGNSSTRTGVGTSPTENPPANQVSIYDVQLPIHAGDAIGLDCCAGGFPFKNFLARSTSSLVQWSPPLLNAGPARSAIMTLPGFEVLVNADIEPDANRNGFGDETQECRGRVATVVGTDAADKLSGTPAGDVIAAGGGSDKVSGLGGSDLICGGSGKDTLNGGAGKDTLLGQKGKDTLNGGAGKDALAGQKGKDALKGRGGKDACKGGKGNDSASSCEVEKSV